MRGHNVDGEAEGRRRRRREGERGNQLEKECKGGGTYGGMEGGREERIEA